MLELVRIDSNGNSSVNWPGANQRALAVGLARTAEEVEQIQRLRYQVFTEDMGAVFPDAHDGIEQDRFDQWCEHLMVRELDTGRVVGTYRILTPEKALEAGGYYSESEFDLSGLGALRDQVVELGRSCTHADYRGGAVIMLLWSGIAEYLRRHGYRYALGCASVSLRDDGVTAAEVWRTVARQLPAAGQPRVTPLHRYPVEKLDSTLPARVPPLIKGYLKLGATICGEPAWDPDFNAADFPVLMDMEAMDERYRRHFGLDEPAAPALATGTR
ncbi:GNAT family N-acetyltransferase [Bordetella genomosp. 1]|uniref:L-ornithine N(alpha)-acyltransferase n=1 Tax=Bordetella genomosp. 1 TaxID=1395607 RepID=A0A261S7U2_9BORD|nr:GNAT family N-acyltransferase [Bordetella genomosp. 1]MDQ8034380.1 GNAT family N-acyltransferase [Bordetella sp.]OZI33235.1 GNAT family N-acetyltransferase [Bordetella genomosp. 1]OZI57275.1 GNAT family N-acetyltransferase [Bordetella genomosp. 1]